MFTLKGVLVNVFKAPTKSNDDGTQTGGQHKIQILGDIPLPEGGCRKDLVTLTAHDVSKYEGEEGIEIEVPIGVFAPAKGQIVYYIPKGL
jgi:hypothetical protein